MSHCPIHGLCNNVQQHYDSFVYDSTNPNFILNPNLIICKLVIRLDFLA